MSVRVIIAAAGRDKWWTDPDRPRHLVQVDGVPLLARTIAQVRRWTEDVHLTSPADWRYGMAGAVRHIRAGEFPSEYASTRDLWSERGRTALLLGDVIWTDTALATVMDCPDSDFRVFGRYGPSTVTGTPYGEIFAASWWPTQHAALDRHLDVVHRTRAAGTVTRPPGWMLLRSWQGTPLGKHRVTRPPFVDIDDETDDVDRPEDLTRHPLLRGDADGYARD